MLADEFAHQAVVMGSGKSMSGSRIDHLVKLNLGPLQFQGKTPGIGRVNVIIQLPMHEEESAMEIGRFGGDVRELVSLRIILGRIHVALGVDGVVIAFTGDRTAGDTGTEKRITRHHPESHAAAVAIAAQADALFIDEGKSAQPADRFGQVAALGDIHLPVAGPGGLRTLAAGHSGISIKADDALGCQGLIGEASAIPAIPNARHLGSAINRHPDGVFFLGVKIGGRIRPLHPAIFELDGKLYALPQVYSSGIDGIGNGGSGQGGSVGNLMKLPGLRRPDQESARGYGMD